jgi:DNA-binding IclR family transcriptional regulator
LKVADSSGAKLEGTSLAVYTYVVKAGRSVGTRDVVRNVGLSSPSVAFRHLQKLEALGLVSKNDAGEYVLKVKVRVRGYFWLGRRLLPRMLVYSFFFMVALAVEVAVLAVHFGVEDYEFKVFLVILAFVTALGLALFLVEGLRVLLRSRRAGSLNSP